MKRRQQLVQEDTRQIFRIQILGKYNDGTTYSGSSKDLHTKEEIAKFLGQDFSKGNNEIPYGVRNLVAVLYSVIRDQYQVPHATELARYALEENEQSMSIKVNIKNKLPKPVTKNAGTKDD